MRKEIEMQQELIEYIKFYIDNLIMYDYIALSISAILVIFFFILTIALKRGLSIFFGFLTLITLLSGVFVSKFAVDEFIRKVEIELLSDKKLQFTNSLFAKIKITNSGKIDFNECQIKFVVYPKSEGFRAYLDYLKPIAQKIIVINEPILIGESLEKSVIVDDFEAINYKIHSFARCK